MVGRTNLLALETFASHIVVGGDAERRIISIVNDNLDDVIPTIVCDGESHVAILFYLEAGCAPRFCPHSIRRIVPVGGNTGRYESLVDFSSLQVLHIGGCEGRTRLAFASCVWIPVNHDILILLEFRDREGGTTSKLHVSEVYIVGAVLDAKLLGVTSELQSGGFLDKQGIVTIHRECVSIERLFEIGQLAILVFVALVLILPVVCVVNCALSIRGCCVTDGLWSVSKKTLRSECQLIAIEIPDLLFTWVATHGEDILSFQVAFRLGDDLDGTATGDISQLTCRSIDVCCDTNCRAETIGDIARAACILCLDYSLLILCCAVCDRRRVVAEVQTRDMEFVCVRFIAKCTFHSYGARART